MQTVYRIVLVTLLSSLMIACGGGGGGGSESNTTTSNTTPSNTSNNSDVSATAPEPVTPATPINDTAPDSNLISIDGMAVKGPLKDAIVSVYTVDTAKAGYKGDLVAEGVTDETAHLMLNIDSQYLTNSLFLMEYTGGTELNGDTPVIPTLRSIATADQIVSGTRLYATPLTTLAVDYAINSLTAATTPIGQPPSLTDFRTALDTASARTKDTFGLGLVDDSIDLFASAPVLSLETDQEKSLAYRTAIEVFAAVAHQIKQEADNQGGFIAADQLVTAISIDMLDGSLDGENNGDVITELASVSKARIQQILSSEPAGLSIPGTSTPIAELNRVIALESTVISPAVVPESLSKPAPSPILIDVVANPAPAPTPEPAPEPAPSPSPEVQTELLVSYARNNVDSAFPINGETLRPQQVYWYASGSSISHVTFYCCKGLTGDASGEPHSAPTTDSSAPFSATVNLNQLTTSGQRELYADVFHSNGDVEHLYATFTISQPSQPAPAPQPAPEPIPEPTPEPTPEPIPEPIPEPTPAPQPVPEPIPEPAPEPTPEPAPEPTPEPIPEPEPTPVEITLSWNMPTTRENGDALLASEIAGYEIYYFLEGTPEAAGEIVAINNGNTTQHSLTINQPGTYIFAISTIDLDGLQSDISDPVSLIIP